MAAYRHAADGKSSAGARAQRAGTRKVRDMQNQIRCMSRAESARINASVKLLFTGDLILLEDAVKLAHNGYGYDFSCVFEYAKKYISGADLSVGVFEGPCAGGDKGYSSSNFADGKPLALNFPDSFAEAVKDAGFDLVTTANNHLLDKGLAGAMRTLDVLDRARLGHIGSYRDQGEKDAVKIWEIQGIRFAFLAYTYGCNNNPVKRTRGGDLSYLTAFLTDPELPEFQQYKAQVLSDFEAVKARNPDVIVVLPHMGKDFSHELCAEAGVSC
jgi:poly-gamma-glutamate capsule biosynthesis protein CapA/YwtB (metallophosphatase superfamily)